MARLMVYYWLLAVLCTIPSERRGVCVCVCVCVCMYLHGCSVAEVIRTAKISAAVFWVLEAHFAICLP